MVLSGRLPSAFEEGEDTNDEIDPDFTDSDQEFEEKPLKGKNDILKYSDIEEDSKKRFSKKSGH